MKKSVDEEETKCRSDNKENKTSYTFDINRYQSFLDEIVKLN